MSTSLILFLPNSFRNFLARFTTSESPSISMFSCISSVYFNPCLIILACVGFCNSVTIVNLFPLIFSWSHWFIPSFHSIICGDVTTSWYGSRSNERELHVRLYDYYTCDPSIRISLCISPYSLRILGALYSLRILSVYTDKFVRLELQTCV